MRDWRQQQLTEYRGATSENQSYDLFKYFASTALLTIGGLLTLSESVFADRIAAWEMLTATGLVAGSGILAVQCMTDIVQIGRGRKNGSRYLRIGHFAVPLLLGAGIAAFLIFLARGLL